MLWTRLGRAMTVLDNSAAIIAFLLARIRDIMLKEFLLKKKKRRKIRKEVLVLLTDTRSDDIQVSTKSLSFYDDITR